jgi:hypothetical protein
VFEYYPAIWNLESFKGDFPGPIHPPMPFAKIDSITPTDPDGMPYAFLGQAFTVFGHNFSLDNDKNTIIFSRRGPDGTSRSYAVKPTTSARERLDVIAPPPLAMAPGNYQVAVDVYGNARSNTLMMTLAMPPAAAAKITQVSPSSQLPTHEVILTIDGLKPNPCVFWHALDPLNSGERLSAGNFR